MSKSLIRDIVTLTREGWRPYGAEPAGFVYDRLGCSRRSRPYWFVRGESFLCVGCAARCCPTRPEGFSLPLPMPVNYPQPETPYRLTPLEMVKKKYLLQTKEAAYCLNVSDRTVRDWIDSGLLTAVKLNPKRVLASDVERLMNDLDVYQPL